MPLFLIFLLISLTEIALFTTIGGLIGLWPTLLIVVLTAMIGAFLVRIQGIARLNELHMSLTTMQNPARPILHGLMILFAGMLLVTPGFFTDALGFALLIPWVRDFFLRTFFKNMIKKQSNAARPQQDQTIDVDFEEVSFDPETPRSDRVKDKSD